MGLAWVFRRRLARLTAAPAPDPAEELKQKLAESRDEAEPAPEPEPPAAELDERRREVHDRARASIEQMRGQSPEG